MFPSAVSRVMADDDHYHHYSSSFFGVLNVVVAFDNRVDALLLPLHL